MEVGDYVYLFPVGPLLHEGKNSVKIENTNPKYDVRVVSDETYPAERKRAEDRAKPVPDDRFLEAIREFPVPDAAAARDRFLLVHRLLESVHNGDGSWGKGYLSWSCLKKKDATHPLVLWVGYPVMAYLTAHSVKPDKVYLERAKAGLEWLLKKQEPNGAFRWYWTTEGSLDGNSVYDTGVAGAALVAGYEATKDKRCLDASEKAAAWAMTMPFSGNANYNMFTVWHLAAHYRVTKEKKLLDFAVQGCFPHVAAKLSFPFFHRYFYWHTEVAKAKQGFRIER
jgi:hypothetical protein